MSKDLFLEHQIREMEMFDTWTKIEVTNKGKQLAIDIANNGNINPAEGLAKLTRFKDLIESSIKELKSNIVVDKEMSVNGVKITYVEGGKVLDYAEDAGWQHLKSKIDYYTKELKFREEQLKQAHEANKSMSDYNGEIIEPVKVKTYRKSYLKITY